jgi:hypothetical protein
VSTASRSNVRDDRETPLKRDGMAEIMEVIWGQREGIYFCEGDWTGRNSLIRLDKFAYARTSIMRLYFTA